MSALPASYLDEVDADVDPIYAADDTELWKAKVPWN